MTPISFHDFHRAVWGYDPYRWQQRLADRVSHEGWPSGIGLPTGTGKTSALDIAIWNLARASIMGEDLPPRRIFLVADRRVLVDQAWQHGKYLLQRIVDLPALAQVEEALRRISSEPPACIRLRGACRTDPAWCRSMDQVGIIASTVDQVGSRMLMRGYGVSGRMKPIEAALVAQDSLLIVDEAHLSGPFLDTLDGLQKLEPVREMPVRRNLVYMTATPDSGASWFDIEEEDLSDPLLIDRLSATKTIELSSSKIDTIVRDREEPCLLLVANTVKTAAAWAKKVDKDKVRGDREVFLITGRMRPIDRDLAVARIEDRLERREPTLVVSTQCIEAGVDWDFDGMVSECASWDSLKQRMGRVNRAGLMKTSAVCTIVEATRYKNRDEGGPPKLCPVYGNHELRTVQWLQQVGTVSCSPGEMPTPPAGCVRSADSAPELLPEYLDLWSQTRSYGSGFDVSLFLHGLQDDRSVHVVWRDMDLSLGTKKLSSLLEALPPSSLEAARIPEWLFRRWIGERPVVKVSGKVKIVSDGVRPGDLVVVPCSYGGLGPHGTFDESSGHVHDVSEQALLQSRGVKLWWHDAPTLDDERPLAKQVSEWIDRDLPHRRHLCSCHHVDAGSRWLFVSRIDRGDEDSFHGHAVSLEDHCSGVRDRVQQACEHLGLPSKLSYDLCLAAALHDLGKLDDRAQRMYGRKPGDPPLGKSGLSKGQPSGQPSSYPRGERHEALSVEIARKKGMLAGASDPELVQHLVASHHGYARPFMRRAQGTALVDDGLLGAGMYVGLMVHDEAARAPDRFHRLQRRYGWVGLAYLESVLRLCDHRQSETERLRGPSPGATIVLSIGASDSNDSTLHERRMPGFCGTTVFDWMVMLGIVHGLSIAGHRATLSWDGTVPRIGNELHPDEITEALVGVRESFRCAWPGGLNKMDHAQIEQLLAQSEEPFRSLVTAMVSMGGRSDLDFVSGGRGGFDLVSKWATEDGARAFSDRNLTELLEGQKRIFGSGKSFRWSPISAMGASGPCSASSDKRYEPWAEWLAMLGACAFTAVPHSTRYGRMRTATTGFHGPRFDQKVLRWPLWSVPMSWDAIRAAVSSSEHGLYDVMWVEADRLVFGTSKNVSYGFGPGRPLL